MYARAGAGLPRLGLAEKNTRETHAVAGLLRTDGSRLARSHHAPAQLLLRLPLRTARGARRVPSMDRVERARSG